VRFPDPAADVRRGSIAEEAPEPPSPALRLRDFVPVELARHRAAEADRPRRTPTDGPRLQQDVKPRAEPAAREAAPTWSDRVTLFADAEF